MYFIKLRKEKGTYERIQLEEREKEREGRREKRGERERERENKIMCKVPQREK